MIEIESAVRGTITLNSLILLNATTLTSNIPLILSSSAICDLSFDTLIYTSIPYSSYMVDASNMRSFSLSSVIFNSSLLIQNTHPLFKLSLSESTITFTNCHFDNFNNIL